MAHVRRSARFHPAAAGEFIALGLIFGVWPWLSRLLSLEAADQLYGRCRLGFRPAECFGAGRTCSRRRWVRQADRDCLIGARWARVSQPRARRPPELATGSIAL